MAIDENSTSNGLLDNLVRDSVLAAVRQEIGEGRQRVKSHTLAMDGIRHLGNSGGRFIYRLILSSPATFRADQELRFRSRNLGESISTSVVSSDDEGIVVASNQPFPADAKLLSVTFDPAFILKALGEFVSSVTSSSISKRFLQQELLSPPSGNVDRFDELNEEQSTAVFEMTAVPIRLLFGPPGTGKTTTLGRAIAEWFDQGKTVLVASTSNKAVDTAMRKVMDFVPPAQHRKLLRVGTSTDESVRKTTVEGKMSAASPKWAARVEAVQDRLAELSEMLTHRTNSDQRFQQLFSEYARLETELNQETRKTEGLLKQVLPHNRVVGCTLAKLILNKDIQEKSFDIVVVDEASMVSLVFALCASTFAKEHLILAGDPKQLPPICQSKFPDARRWFGKNCYDWFGVKDYNSRIGSNNLASQLRTQYRMTEEIGGVVSRLSYGNSLRHGRSEGGRNVTFIDLPSEWQTTHYSVSEGSYFHLSSIPLVKAVVESLTDDREVLLLSPFRPQRSLLAALALDLKEQVKQFEITASTIHQSQGSESQTVILDLTTHRIDKLVAFFRDDHCSNLFNVGISRARNRLFILGNRNMIRVLSRELPFWSDFLAELDNSVEVLPASQTLDEQISSSEVCGITSSGETTDFPVIYCHRSGHELDAGLVHGLRNAGISRRLLVLPEEKEDAIDDTGLIVRHSRDLPPVYSMNGYVAVPYRNGWLPTYSPQVARELWRIGYSHLADEEIRPTEVKRFFCPDCANGELLLKRIGGEGWFMACSNGRYSQCYYRKRLSLEDAKAKVRLNGMTCPKGHPLTARQGGRTIFLGCENYPNCDYVEKLSLLEGT